LTKLVIAVVLNSILWSPNLIAVSYPTFNDKDFYKLELTVLALEAAM
jgi:hypothetical protein